MVRGLVNDLFMNTDYPVPTPEEFRSFSLQLGAFFAFKHSL